MLLRKAVFPHEYLTSESVLKQNCLPSKDKFYSSLKQSHITDEDYAFAKKIFIEAKCRNIEDYLNLYLKTDVLLLVEIFENFRKTIFTNYGLDPASFLTISSLAMQASLMKSNKQIDLLHDMSVYTEFETNVRGGFTSVVKGKVTFNNKYLSTYDPKKPISSGVFLDVNALYATILSGKLPVGDFKEFSEDEIENFDRHAIDLDGDRCYSLVIDFEIPNDKKIDTDELPLSISQEEITVDELSPFTNQMIQSSGCKFTKQKSLIASHKSQQGYFISLNLLRLYESLGLKCTKIHRIF